MPTLFDRGLISADALSNLIRKVNDISRNPRMSQPFEGAGGRGFGIGGASGEHVIAPNYGLTREIVASGRSGRPVKTKPLAIGNEQRILDRAEQRMNEGPRIVGSKAEQEEILRNNWAQHGPERDFDWDNFRTWDREAAIWNKSHPDRPIGENYRFGTVPEFEQAFEEKYLAGQKKPYPGAKMANEYFASDQDTWKHTAFTSRRQMTNTNEDMLPSELQK